MSFRLLGYSRYRPKSKSSTYKGQRVPVYTSRTGEGKVPLVWEDQGINLTIILVDIHNLIYFNPNYDYENMPDSL